jgi:hypothetical protein
MIKNVTNSPISNQEASEKNRNMYLEKEIKWIEREKQLEYELERQQEQ